jgi:PAS domain-containing protein
MSLRYLYNTWISPQRWLDRMGVRTPARIVMGLVLLTTCVLLTAKVIRLFPDEREALLRERTLLSEISSLQAASAITHRDYPAIRDFLQLIVWRNDDVLSAGLRKQDGTLLIETPGHERHWAGALPDVSTPTHVHVLLFEKQKPWGQLEIRFMQPPRRPILAEWLCMPPVKLTVFILAGVFLLFWLYLSRMLLMLDPSEVIPRRLQVLMDALVEGVAVVDGQDRIVMANQSFANTAFSPVERLIGRELSSLPWLALDGDQAPENYPWKAAGQTDLQQRGVSIRLQIGTRHARRLNVNASPIFGSDGTRRGVLVTFDDQTIIEADNLELANFVGRFGDEISRLREQLQSGVDHGHLEMLEGLARTAGHLAQLCESASTPERHAGEPEMPKTLAALDHELISPIEEAT